MRWRGRTIRGRAWTRSSSSTASPRSATTTTRRRASPRSPGARGVTPVEAFIDLCLETDGRVVLQWPLLNQDLDAIEAMITSDVVLMGLADAGAHVGQIIDASQPTYFLTYWVRERGVFTVEEAVRRLTSDTAEFMGLPDRGVLRPGAFADVNVIDWDHLGLAMPEFRPRLPVRRRPLDPTGDRATTPRS